MPVFQDPDEFVESLRRDESAEEVKEEQSVRIHDTEYVGLVCESASESDTSSFNSDFVDSD